MRFPKKGWYWVFLLVYAVVLVVLVNVEKANADGNIKTIYDGLWYSVVTLTTVGYGDLYPVTPIGKILGLVVILSSFGVLGFFIGVFTNIIQTRMEKKKKGFLGTDFTNHFVIIGWDSFAKNVADQIVHANCKIAIVTDDLSDLEIIKDTYSEDKVFVLLSDYDNVELLEKVNIVQSNSVFANFVDDTQTLIYSINLKKRYDVNLVVALQSSELKDTFLSVGVNHVVSKSEITSRMVASYIFEPDVALFTEDLIQTSVGTDDFDMHQYLVTVSNPFLNMDYMDAFVATKTTYDCVLIGITKMMDSKRTLIKNPSKGMKIELGDYLLVIASGDLKRHLEADFDVEEGVISA